MGYRERLKSLDYRESLASRPVDWRVVLLTGQSSFRTSALLPAQRDFLAAVAPQGAEILEMGFPFHPAFAGDETAPVPPPILAASVRNVTQFLWSLFSAEYQRIVAAAVQPLFSNTARTLQIVTGSCGLQLLASASAHLQIPPGLQCQVVAVGPVLIRPGSIEFTALQGRQDWWSRILHCGPVHARCNARHLDYWHSLEVRSTVARMLASDLCG